MPRITVIGTCHAENPFWIARALRSVAMQIEAPDFEVIVTMDRPTEAVRKAVSEFNFGKINNTAVTLDYGDLGLSRNHGVSLARGKYVCFLDMDDLFGCRWLRQAYEYARTLERERDDRAAELVKIGAAHSSEVQQMVESFVLHQEMNVFFGAQNFLHRHIGDDSPEFDAKDQLQFNLWSALAFAPKSVFERFPYRAARGGIGYEDFMFNTETLGGGVAHRVVPGSAYMIRLKMNEQSMSTRYVQKRLVIPKMALFDRRDLPDATAQPDNQRRLPDEVIKQVRFAHEQVGERRLIITPDLTIRQYPRQRCWNDQAWIRDQIGDAANVILTDNLHQGGAEKYAIDFAKATGAVIVETAPNENGVWRKRAAEAGVRVVSYKPIVADLNEEEQALAMQRALMQAELRTLIVCNSKLGWFLVHQNAEPLARRVICCSFATIPLGNGQEVCPPFFLNEPFAPNLTILTDNETHAKRIEAYCGVRTMVLPPKCGYDGPSKKSQITKKRLRVLWAGRGSPEKNPGILPALAALLEDKADIHVWGDVKPLNGPENLKYRGPFDGFAAIDGSYDVYLNTSITEGMPNTALEAVMADLPVVGPEIGGLPLLASRLYKGDPAAIAQAILMAVEAPASEPKARVIKWRDEFDASAKAIVEEQR